MSGLCVTVDFSGAPCDVATLLAMASAAGRQGSRAHRTVGGAGLCHLAVHATAESLREQQPVSSPDGSVYIVADVRLDNHQELIHQLTADGFLDRENPGDAELLVAAYRRWGVACPIHLLGDFAFVVWDTRQRQVFAACDALGVKPLHYARVGTFLCLGSEAQQVLRHPAVPHRLDEIAVGDYLLDACSEPGRTLFADVRRLPAGHCLIATSRGERVERYWTPDPDARTLYRRDEDYSAHFLDLFQSSVRARLRTQPGPVGILMSGGLDSCSVASMASQCLKEDGSHRLFAASFFFDQLPECDERPFIQAVAEDLGFEIEPVFAERFAVFGGSATCRPALEGPFFAWDLCYDEALRRASSRGARVLLTGHGGDDLLMGSALVYADRLRRGDLSAVLEVVRYAAARRQAWRWILYHYLAKPLLPHGVDRRLRQAFGRAPGAELPDWFDAGFVRRIDLAGRYGRPRSQHRTDAARQALYDHVLQAPWDRAAHWYDQHAAGFGIEVRHPFLDRRLVEFLISIPPSRLFQPGFSKPLLRQAMAGLLPEAVRLRSNKTQLGGFLDFSLGQECEQQIDQLLEAPLASELGILDAQRLQTAYRRYRNGKPSERDGFLWYSLALEVWLREHATTLHMETPLAFSLPAA